jgi:hypothetical protein
MSLSGPDGASGQVAAQAASGVCPISSGFSDLRPAFFPPRGDGHLVEFGGAP